MDGRKEEFGKDSEMLGDSRKGQVDGLRSLGVLKDGLRMAGPKRNVGTRNIGGSGTARDGCKGRNWGLSRGCIFTGCVRSRIVRYRVASGI